MKLTDIHYFMNLAKIVSENSKCLSRKIGTVLVKDHSVVSTGYNGPPRNVGHCQYHEIIDNKLRLNYHLNYQRYSSLPLPLTHKNAMVCPRKRAGFKSGEGMQFCIAAHAEFNAIIQAARNGVETKGCQMFCWCGMPCFECAKAIINAGISQVYHFKKHNFKGSAYDFDLSKTMFDQAKVETIAVEMENFS